MLRALVIAYHFPPIGGGGVQRTLRFARYLSEFGVQPVIMTGPGEHEGQWTPTDPTIVAKVADVPVIRASVPPPPPGRRIGRAVDRILGRHDAYIRWWIDSIVRCGRSHGEGIDVILGELVPYETAFGVERLGRLLGVPWIADLQDPWALDEMWLYPSVIHRLADRSRMRSTLRTAAAVVMNTPEAAERLRTAFPEFRDRRVVSISNGFDAEDFLGPSLPRDDGSFRIVHSGTLHTDFGLRHRKTRRLRQILGGMPVSGVDFLTRSHVFLLQAVDAVTRSDPALRSVIEVHLVGVVSEADRAAAAAYPFVRFHGYRSHAESISLLRSADLLFLPMQDLPVGLRAGLVPGKAYEYMASGTPILAGVPDGDARDLLLSVGTATVCRPADVECLASALRLELERWQARAPRSQPDPSVLERFEARRLTSDLAALLKEVVGAPQAPSDGCELTLATEDVERTVVSAAGRPNA